MNFEIESWGNETKILYISFRENSLRLIIWNGNLIGCDSCTDHFQQAILKNGFGELAEPIYQKHFSNKSRLKEGFFPLTVARIVWHFFVYIATRYIGK